MGGVVIREAGKVQVRFRHGAYAAQPS
jgi:hypothetical protein